MKPKAFEKYDFNKEYFEVPLGYFLKIDKKSENKSTSSATVEISTKDGRIFKCWILSKQLEKLNHWLQALGNPDRIENFFAFDFFKTSPDLEQLYDGWKIYDIISEFKRQGLPVEPLKSNQESEPAVSMPSIFHFTMREKKKLNRVIRLNSWTTLTEAIVQHILPILLFLAKLEMMF